MISCSIPSIPNTPVGGLSTQVHKFPERAANGLQKFILLLEKSQYGIRLIVSEQLPSKAACRMSKQEGCFEEIKNRRCRALREDLFQGSRH